MTNAGAETPRNPQFRMEIDYPTAFAIGEYIIDRDVTLTNAVRSLAEIGLSLVKREEAGWRITTEYPAGEMLYTSPPGVEGLVENVRRIDVPLPQDLQDGIRTQAMECEVGDERMFARIIETARNVRIVLKRGGIALCVAPNGTTDQISLPREDG